VKFTEQFARFPMWNLVAWAVWAGAFAVLEGMGVKSNRFATLTYLSLHTVPRWALAMFLGWLAYHFIVQYGSTLDQ
jgi:hypothetical protein